MAIGDDFPNGDGSSGDPYQITTLTQLQAVRTYANLGHHWILMNDIDATPTRTWNQGSGANADEYYGFNPITPFIGVFRGNYHRITNLYINRGANNGASGNDNVGLFGTMTMISGTEVVNNLTLRNVDILGSTYVGGLAGQIDPNSNTRIVSNVHVTGSIETDEGTNVGGLAGYLTDATVSDCSASVAITHTTNCATALFIGGFAGSLGDVVISDCRASGSIGLDLTTTIAGASVGIGGFSGRINASGGADIDNCISSTEVEAEITAASASYCAVGGFVGQVTSPSDFYECFAYGDVSYTGASGAHVGGFVGYLDDQPIAKCGATGDIQNNSTHATVNTTGGFAGTISNTSGTVTNSFAQGTVNFDGNGHADAYLGGFVGKASDTGGTISYCYATGEVYASQTNGGGFSGNASGITQTDLFYDNQTSGYTTDGGSATGKTTTQMKTQSTFTDASWNFDAVWYLPTGTRSPGLSSTVWLSKSDKYDNLDIGSTNDDAAFAVSIPTTNIIRWLDTLESLICGTAGDEWLIRSNKLNTPISPTNFTIKDQTTWGSANIQPRKINNAILFIDFVKRKVRELTYAEPEYVAPDLTELAEHITETGVVCVDYQKNPESILWCVLTDGSMISMEYDREQNVIAWSVHETDGDILSVCVTPAETEDDVWVSVKRTIGLNDKLYVEKLYSRTLTSLEDCFFVDSGITYDGAATSTITGLNHLEGETVKVLADGVVFDDAVVASGQITLKLATVTTTASVVQVGLPYTALLKPMRIVVQTAGGVSLAAITRINEIKVTFLNSLGVQYGVDEDDLYDVDFDDIRLENAEYITDLFSGDVPLTMPNNYTFENPIIIASSDPLPMTVKSIVVGFEQVGR